LLDLRRELGQRAAPHPVLVPVVQLLHVRLRRRRDLGVHFALHQLIPGNALRRRLRVHQPLGDQLVERAVPRLVLFVPNLLEGALGPGVHFLLCDHVTVDARHDGLGVPAFNGGRGSGAGA